MAWHKDRISYRYEIVACEKEDLKELTLYCNVAFKLTFNFAHNSLARKILFCQICLSATTLSLCHGLSLE
jgi:hypothetical protein